MTHRNRSRTEFEDFANSIKHSTPAAEHRLFEPFGDIPIDERWRPAGCETNPLMLKLWLSLTPKQREEHAWDVYKKVSRRHLNKSEFDFK